MVGREFAMPGADRFHPSVEDLELVDLTPAEIPRLAPRRPQRAPAHAVIPQFALHRQEHCGAKPRVRPPQRKWLDLANQIGRRLFDPYALVAPIWPPSPAIGEQRIGSARYNPPQRR